MTLLVAWAGIDTHGPASVYIASDSRISWANDAKYDNGRKVFAFANHPDILGYCGDVLFPSLVLSQIMEIADAGLLFEPQFTAKQKFQAIVTKLNHLFDAYPHLHAGLAENSLNVIHASREVSNNKQFFCHSISWTKDEGWKGKRVSFPEKSGVLFSLGSGARHFNKDYKRYQLEPQASTSRNVFQCFCNTLERSKDIQVGGAPQLVGIYRKPQSTAINFGIVFEKSRYFLGAKIDNLKTQSAKIDWRNRNFERCDGKSMSRLSNAQAQPDPLSRL